MKVAVAPVNTSSRTNPNNQPSRTSRPNTRLHTVLLAAAVVTSAIGSWGTALNLARRRPDLPPPTPKEPPNSPLKELLIKKMNNAPNSALRGGAVALLRITKINAVITAFKQAPVEYLLNPAKLNNLTNEIARQISEDTGRSQAEVRPEAEKAAIHAQVFAQKGIESPLLLEALRQAPNEYYTNPDKFSELSEHLTRHLSENSNQTPTEENTLAASRTALGAHRLLGSGGIFNREPFEPPATYDSDGLPCAGCCSDENPTACQPTDPPTDQST